jgi:hypothetical protein
LELEGPLYFSGPLKLEGPLCLNNPLEIEVPSDKEDRKIKKMWDALSPGLNERYRRLFGAAWASSIGYGGITAVHNMTGIAINTISNGIKELGEGIDDSSSRIRKPGGGPKLTQFQYPDIQDNIRRIIDGKTYSDPSKVLS